MAKANHHHLRYRLYVANFFLGLSLALAAYVSSTLLEETGGPVTVSLAYALAALAGIVIIINNSAARLINRFGSKNIIPAIVIVDTLACLGLSLQTHWVMAIALFGLTGATSLGLRLILDEYLEQVSLDQSTGRTRGLFLTISNLAWFIAPLPAAYLISNQHNVGSAFVLSGIVLLPVAYLASLGLTNKKTWPINRGQTPAVIKKLWQTTGTVASNLRRLWLIDLLLNLFYALMVIYLPLYLQEQGLTWPQIGVVLTVMLVPFLIIEWPAGWLADRFLGEKELMMVGFTIAGLATILLPFVDGSFGIMGWAILLFLTRVGASLLESMKEAFLFKELTPGDAGLLSIFRGNDPLAYIGGTIISSLVFATHNFEALFTGLGVLMLFGVLISQRLVDTR